jgi:putative permease
MSVLRAFIGRFLNDPQLTILVLLLLGTLSVVVFAGDILAPLLASIVIAYLLEGLVSKFQRWRTPRLLAVWVVFLAFMASMVFAIIALVPLLSREAAVLLQQELPNFLAQAQRDIEAMLMMLAAKFPDIVAPTSNGSDHSASAGNVLALKEAVRQQIEQITFALKRLLKEFGQRALSSSLDSVVGLITLLIYAVVTPMLVFFFLKDKTAILRWFRSFLPANLGLAAQVWRNVDAQIANYVRGKFGEMLIVWFITYITFALLNLKFALLLAFLVGLSVLVPVVGAVLVTVPVMVVAYFQFQFSAPFAYVIIAFGIIQALDGYLLVPLMFAEVVDLHPVAIMAAILFFGGIWGFWGVFFAIPLATLVQAVLQAIRPSEIAALDILAETAGENQGG